MVLAIDTNCISTTLEPSNIRLFCVCVAYTNFCKDYIKAAKSLGNPNAGRVKGSDPLSVA